MSEAEFGFLTLEDVLELHELQLGAYGGATGIRSPELLESAIMTPQASFVASMFTMVFLKWQQPMRFILPKSAFFR